MVYNIMEVTIEMKDDGQRDVCVCDVRGAHKVNGILNAFYDPNAETEDYDTDAAEEARKIDAWLQHAVSAQTYLALRRRFRKVQLPLAEIEKVI